jgi:hypothetical protein
MIQRGIQFSVFYDVGDELCCFVTCSAEQLNNYQLPMELVQFVNLTERERLVDLGINCRILLKWMLEIYVVMMSTVLTREGLVAGIGNECIEHGSVR